MTRYQEARMSGNEAYEKAVKEDESLLAHFGLRLINTEQGVTAAVEDEIKGSKKINIWNVVAFEPKAWDVVRPLLVELRERRKGHSRDRLAAK